jgi:hypothetical protein
MPKLSVAASPRFVIRKSVISEEFLRLEYKDELKINWTTDKKLASPYASKYSAKANLDTLRKNFEIPLTIVVEQLIIS